MHITDNQVLKVYSHYSLWINDLMSFMQDTGPNPFILHLKLPARFYYIGLPLIELPGGCFYNFMNVK